MSQLNNITRFQFCQDELQIQTLQKLIKHKKDHIEILDKLLQGKEYKSEFIKQRMRECATFVTFADNMIVNANFCKDKFCPVCAWRRSLKNFAINSKAISHIVEKGDINFGLLTLTIKNISAEEVGKAIENMQYAIKKLTLQTKWKKHISGAIKTVEITYNPRTNAYHPHVHMIIAFKDGYFEETYITQREFGEMWEKALKSDYTPIVDIRTIKPKIDKKGKESLAGAVAEVSKYPLKISSMLETVTGNDFFTIYEALEHKRLLSRSGIFKQALKELNISEEIELTEKAETIEEAIITEDGEVRDVIKKYKNSIDFVWKNGRYVDLKTLQRNKH